MAGVGGPGSALQARRRSHMNQITNGRSVSTPALSVVLTRTWQALAVLNVRTLTMVSLAPNELSADTIADRGVNERFAEGKQ